MYKMPYFTEGDEAVVLAFMKANPFIVLTGNADGVCVLTQVPVLVEQKEDKLILRGHVMRQTDHFKAFEHNPQVLALFTGPHCYVSSGWYAERNIGGTWNYMSVHARGTIRFTDDAGTVQLVTDLTRQYETGSSTAEFVEDMPEDYVRKLAKAIAAFEIVVEYLQPIFKLSQNRSDESYKNIVAQLEAADHQSREIAGEMKVRRPGLF